MNEQVVIREENPEARVRVVPSDDFLVWKIPVLELVNMFPGVLCEGHMGTTLVGMFAPNAVLHYGCIVMVASDHHAADFGFH